jgi:hypothetical protein
MARSKKPKAGIFEILVDGKFVMYVPEVNELCAEDKYERNHPNDAGKNVKAKWARPAPPGMTDAEKVANDLTLTRQMAERAKSGGV